MQRQTKLFELGDDLLFSLKDIAYTPVVPKMNEPFTVTGKVNLFGIPFLAPAWVIVTATYPATWWEQIIPIIGAPEVRESSMVVGSDFEITFKRGFLREGEFALSVRVYPGPTFPLDSIVFPPAPAFATEETTFMVAGEVPPAGFRDLRILSYSKNGGTPVTEPGVLELEVGDRCRVNFSFEHRGDAETGKFHAAIWVWQLFDPHDEKIANEKTFSVPSSIDWETFEDYYVDIPITSAIGPGSYGLYGKIVDIPGADIFSSYLKDVITIVGVPTEKFENLRIISYETDLPIGGTCHVATKFEYQGPSVTRNLYAAIGNNDAAGFDEICKGQKSKTVGPDDTPKTYEDEIAIPITSAIDPAGSPYDLYAKVCHGVACMLVDAESEHLQNVITIIGEEIDFSLSKPSASPSHVAPGDSVTIRCSITSLCTKSQTITVKAKIYEGSILPGHGDKLDELSKTTTISPGQTKDVTFYHTAIGTDAERRDVEVEVYVGGTLIVQDEWDDIYYVEKKFAGAITGKWINKAPEGSKIPIPTEVTVDDNTFEVGVRYKNYSGFTVTGGCKVEVRDPNGILRASPAVDWTGMSHNEELSKEYNICRVDKPGNWTIHIDFLMDSTVVDDYDGLLFTAVKEAQYEGTISKKQLKYNNTIRSIPVSNVPQDNSGIVSIWGRNDMNSNQKMGIWWQVKDPDGHVVEEYSRWEAYWTGPGNAQEFIGGRFDLDKAGTYTIAIQLFMNPDDQVCVDDYYGTLCTVAGAPPPTAISFDVMIWGTGGFGHYDKWMCYYWDPATGGWVGDEKWHYPYQDIGFTNVEPGGYLAVFLLEDSTVSGQFSSPTFDALDGGRYQYDLDLGRVSKIG